MRTLLEEWQPLFGVVGEASNSAVAIAELPSGGSSAEAIEIQQLQLPKLPDFPLEEFLAVGFTNHCQILTSAKDLDERLFCIKRAAHEHYRVEDLKRSIRNDEYRHQGQMPNSFLETMPSAQCARSIVHISYIRQSTNVGVVALA